MAEKRSWEVEEGIEAAHAARYYDYFAQLLLQPIAVPGSAFIEDVRARTEALFDLADQSEAASAIDGFFSNGDAEDLQKELAVDRTRLFRGVDPEGLLPPYGSFWCDDSDLLIRLPAEYQRAGMAASAHNHERADYLGVCFAFLALLAQRESQTGDAQERQQLAQSRSDFLVTHVSPWIGRYCEAALDYAETGFFRGLLMLMAELFG